MANILPEKKYLLINRSDDSANKVHLMQLCLPSNTSGKSTLKPGESCILKGKDINDYIVKLAKDFRDKKENGWLQLKEYDPKKIEKGSSEEKAVADEKVITDAQAKAKLEAEAKAKVEEEARVKAEEEAKAKADAEEKAKLEAKAKAKTEEEKVVVSNKGTSTKKKTKKADKES